MMVRVLPLVGYRAAQADAPHNGERGDMMSTTSPQGYIYRDGATNVNPFWEQSDNPVDYVASIELVDDLSHSGGYIVRYTDQDGAGHTLGNIDGFYTDIRATQSGDTISIYGTKNGSESLIITFTVSGGSGGMTEEQVREIVVSYGYQTADQVRTITEGYGYQTAQQVQSTVEGYGYQTGTQVQNAINTAIFGAMDEPY